MNYLGHSFFSKENESLFITGNVLGDFYKGRPEKLDYPQDLVNGIVFHRYLDKITDENPIIHDLKASITDGRLFKGAIIDIFLDYFLAKNWNHFSSISLEIYSKNLYKLIGDSEFFLPKNGKRTFFYLKKENWIFNYQYIDFIEDVLSRMGSHYKNGHILKNSIKYLKSDPNFYEDNSMKIIDKFIDTATKSEMLSADFVVIMSTPDRRLCSMASNENSLTFFKELILSFSLISSPSIILSKILYIPFISPSSTTSAVSSFFIYKLPPPPVKPPTMHPQAIASRGVKENPSG